jgi:hypothetical protein
MTQNQKDLLYYARAARLIFISNMLTIVASGSMLTGLACAYFFGSAS